MKSKRTTSMGSSRTSSHEGIDEVDADSSDSDSDDELMNQTHVTYEDVRGAASPVFTHKVPKPEEVNANVTSISGSASTISANQPTSALVSRKGVKSSKSSPAQSQSTAKKHQQQHHHHASNVQESTYESSSSDEKSSSVAVVNQSLFLKLVNFVRAFFENRHNWSVTEESFIICFGFMVFTILVGCILHYLMA
jgi:hypothetical protein